MKHYVRNINLGRLFFWSRMCLGFLRRRWNLSKSKVLHSEPNGLVDIYLQLTRSRHWKEDISLSLFFPFSTMGFPRERIWDHKSMLQQCSTKLAYHLYVIKQRVLSEKLDDFVFGWRRALPPLIKYWWPGLDFWKCWPNRAGSHENLLIKRYKISPHLLVLK